MSFEIIHKPTFTNQLLAMPTLRATPFSGVRRRKPSSGWAPTTCSKRSARSSRGEISTLNEYLVAPRAGRVVRLNGAQRTAVWRVYEVFATLLERARLQTWSQMRRHAVETVRAGHGPVPYDAVVVDEAQDLEPSVLRLLDMVCRSPNRLFVTADANQSIYGSGFRWHDVHTSLRFQGRTGVLHMNYCTTREIGEAAQSYLSDGIIDDEPVERLYAHSGPPPVVRAVANIDDEADLLARFLPGAARLFHLGLSSCAVLVPTEKAGRAIAARLTYRGVDVAFMSGRDLDLGRRCVKVVTLKSAKGLEFPIVALAGFLDGPYPPLPKGITAEEAEEVLRRERRTMFVGMTRAVCALLVVSPSRHASPLLHDFDATLWNVGA